MVNKIKRMRGLIFLGLLINLFFISIVIATETISDQTETNLVVNGVIRCSNNGFNWIDNSQAGTNYVNTTGAVGMCYNSKGKDYTGLAALDKCCPSGSQCQAISVSPGWQCVYNEKYYCGDFNTEPDCRQNTNWNVANYTAFTRRLANLSIHLCGNDLASWNPTSCSYIRRNCTCVWDATGNSCNLLQQEQTIKYIETGCTGTPQIQLGGSCESAGVENNECDTKGTFTITWTSTRTEPYVGPCENPPESIIPCDSITKLNFFSMINIISVLFTMIIIYFFILINKKSY